MFVVFYTVKLVYIRVFMNFSTTYCLFDRLMGPWDICVYVCMDVCTHQTMQICFRFPHLLYETDWWASTQTRGS
jgi:hypothetical protein